jgi:hypothetical protein
MHAPPFYPNRGCSDNIDPRSGKAAVLSRGGPQPPAWFVVNTFLGEACVDYAWLAFIRVVRAHPCGSWQPA